MNENESNKNQVNEVDDSKLEDVAGGALFDGEILNPFIQEWAKTQPPYIINEFLDNLNNDKNFQKMSEVAKKKYLEFIQSKLDGKNK